MGGHAICPQCGGDAPLAFETRDLNRARSSGTFPYAQCEACGLVFLTEIPEDLAAHYEPDYYKTLNVPDVQREADVEHFKIDLVEEWVPSGRLLEIGSSRGAFALMARQAGYDVTVVEMDRRCVDFMNASLGVRAVASDDPASVLASLGPHDVIALWHVIEHLPDPWTLLDGIAVNLAPGGVLVLATPNPESLQFRLMKGSWPHVDAPRHTCLVPRKALVDRMARHGLRMVDVRTADLSARSGSRFGWGAYLGYQVRGARARRLAYLAGCALSVPMMLVERGRLASAYTAVFRK